jgi:hypothetical protein
MVPGGFCSRNSRRGDVKLPAPEFETYKPPSPVVEVYEETDSDPELTTLDTDKLV